MDSTITRRTIGARICLAAAATTLTLTVSTMSTMAPPAPQLPSVSAPRVSTQAVALMADPNPFEQIWAIATGADSHYPLPAGANPIAPITEQVVRSAVTYAQQLATGQGKQIPAEISAQAANLAKAIPAVQDLLIEDVAIIPIAVFSAAFLTVALIASLPASASALAGLPGIWLNALVRPPLQWVYNGFAIRNTIAVALQPPSSQLQPPPAAAASAGPEPTTARVKSRPDNTGAAPRFRTSKKRLSTTEHLTTSALPTTKKGAAPASDTTASSASDTTASPSSKRSDRPKAETSRATTQPKTRHTGQHRSQSETASKPSA
jgi:hypothetical protein